MISIMMRFDTVLEERRRAAGAVREELKRKQRGQGTGKTRGSELLF
jgi:hypothetical protein